METTNDKDKHKEMLDAAGICSVDFIGVFRSCFGGVVLITATSWAPASGIGM